MSVLIKAKADEFVSRQEAFTSVDIANAIKRDGTWIRNSDIAEWLRNNFFATDYTNSLITVGVGNDSMRALLYHHDTYDSAHYDKVDQQAITPDEFNKIHAPKPRKKVATSLTEILDTNRMKVILDRSQPIQPVVDEMLNHWSYDLLSRSPGAAYTDDGIFQGTDLDLACFLFALVDRNAVINIPSYKGRRPTQVTEGETIVSKDNRHGAILGVSANKENFSFSVRIKDANVMTTNSVGEFRNFMLIDVDGKWYDGWKNIEFMPDAEENDFLTNNSLWSGNTVVFNNFVHPNRWVSFYGQYYFATKALIDRLTEEAKYLKDVAKSMRDRGIIIGGNGGEKKQWPKKTVVGEQKSIKVPAFEAEIEYPEISGIYPNPVGGMLPNYNGTTDSELLKATENRARSLTYSIIPRLRFATRATEYAFHLHSENGKKMPAWIQNAVWDRKYVLPKKKKVWNRLVFKRGIALRYRNYEKSEMVAAD